MQAAHDENDGHVLTAHCAESDVESAELPTAAAHVAGTPSVAFFATQRPVEFPHHAQPAPAAAADDVRQGMHEVKSAQPAPAEGDGVWEGVSESVPVGDGVAEGEKEGEVDTVGDAVREKDGVVEGVGCMLDTAAAAVPRLAPPSVADTLSESEPTPSCEGDERSAHAPADRACRSGEKRPPVEALMMMEAMPP